MTILQCLYICKIAEYGSFNEAAKQLFVAQSSLSVSVKSLEQELNIKIFERVGNGVQLTNDGVEFLGYARQIVEQSDFITNRYSKNEFRQKLYISAQHYDFVADIFTKLLNETTDNRYRFSLREMKTYDVISEVETSYCDIGIIVIKDTDFSVIERYLNQRNITFTSVFKVRPHVYVRNGHPLAKLDKIANENLINYPFVSYEQGEHNHLFFTEELSNIHSEKQVEISDRASLMNCLIGTDSYTIGTGIMPSLLNEGRIVSIPFKSDDLYTIGYILRTDKKPSALTERFINMLKSNSKTF